MPMARVMELSCKPLRAQLAEAIARAFKLVFSQQEKTLVVDHHAPQLGIVGYAERLRFLGVLCQLAVFLSTKTFNYPLRIPPGHARAGGGIPAFQPRYNRLAEPPAVGPAFRTYETLGRRVRCARKSPLGWPRGGAVSVIALPS